MKVRTSYLSSLCTVAARDASRYTMNAVHLAQNGGTVIAEATDGRRLVRYTAPVAEGDETVTAESLLLTADKVLAGLKRGGTVAEVLPADSAAPYSRTVRTLAPRNSASTELVEKATTVVESPAGCFPETDSILGDMAKRAPAVVVILNPLLVVDILKAAAAWCDATDSMGGGKARNPAVRISVYDASSPVKFDMGPEAGESFVAAVMPITGV